MVGVDSPCRNGAAVPLRYGGGEVVGRGVELGRIVGEVELAPQAPCVRCTMVTRAQPELSRDLDIYRTVARHHAGNLGVWTTVSAPGTIRTGDPVELLG